MESDQKKWDATYSRIDYARTVAKPLHDFASLLESLLLDSEPAPSALDIACGTGQNSLFLAEKGFRVDAMDISPIALNLFSHEHIARVQVDFDTYRIQENCYDLLIDFYFLERRLFPFMISSLKPNGVLMFQSFLETKEPLSNPDHTLKSQELLGAFRALRIIHYQETKETVTLVARKNQ